MRQFINIVESHGLRHRAAPEWFVQGEPVADIEQENGDAPYILEGDEWDWEWRLCRVPIEAIYDPENGCLETDEEAAARYAAIRSVADHELYPPLLELGAPGYDGKCKILDGWHRLQVAKQRGLTAIRAHVGRAR